MEEAYEGTESKLSFHLGLVLPDCLILEGLEVRDVEHLMKIEGVSSTKALDLTRSRCNVRIRPVLVPDSRTRISRPRRRLEVFPVYVI